MHVPLPGALEEPKILLRLMLCCCLQQLACSALLQVLVQPLELVLVLSPSCVSPVALQTVCVDVNQNCCDLLLHGSWHAAIAAHRRVNWT